MRMEIEKTPPKMGKKLWDLARIVFYMMRRGISKSKLMLDFDFLMKRGKMASKAIGNLMIHHHHHRSPLSCRSDDVLSSFISPGEYEFSCSNSPAYPHRHSRRKNNQRHRPKYDRRFHRQAEEIDVLQQVFDILNVRDHIDQQHQVMEFSPPVRQLRVTDSPFPANDRADQENHQVDRDAEKFINRFYMDLRNQRRIAAFESPLLNHM